MTIKTFLKSLEVLLHEYKIFIRYGPSLIGYIALLPQIDSKGPNVVKLRHSQFGAHIDHEVQ